MKPGIYIADYSETDLFSGTSPENLANANNGWKKDIFSLGPWISDPFPAPGNHQGIWYAGKYQGSAVIWVTHTATSSMDVARHLISRDLMAPWSSVLAVSQTSGRGQRQKEWISPPGNIYGTWFWPFNRAADEGLSRYRPMASLLAGYILASVFLKKGVDVRIKWPNDILIDNRKLCGILVEDRNGNMLVGMGVNLATAPEKTLLKDPFVLPATCLDPERFTFSPLLFWAELMESGKNQFEEIIRTTSPEQFAKTLETRIAWIGEEIMIRQEGKEPFSAILSGIAPDGGLKLFRHGREETIYTGTIRPCNVPPF